MFPSEHVRYHEAAHAVAAEKLGIGLENEAIVLNSDADAWVNVKNEPCVGENLHDWTIRRLAVKLAGPIARILQSGEVLEWDTLRCSAEYHTDFEVAKKSCFEYLKLPFSHEENSDVDAMMKEAACCASKCVQSHQVCIVALAESIAKRDSFSRTEVLEVLSSQTDHGTVPNNA